MSSNQFTLTVFVPAFNEKENLEATVDTLLGALNISIEDFEIVIVNDGSTDGTREIADALARRHSCVRAIHNRHNEGLGESYRHGVDAARKNYFVFIPGDNTWPYRSLLSLFGNFGKAELVTSYSSNPEVRPFARRMISTTYTQILNALFGRKMRYYNGLTIYPVSFLRSTGIRFEGFSFQAETLLKALHYGYSYIEIGLPIEERTSGKSKAVTPKNIRGVVKMFLRTFWDLRVRHRRAPLRRMEPAQATPAQRQKTPPLRILLSGASSGIGAALLEGLAQDGHTLFVCARRGELLEQVTRGGTLARWKECDVSDERQVLEFLSWVEGQSPALDVLINCAGAFGAIGPIVETDTEEWFRTIRVNLLGPYLMIKHSLPLLRRSEDARILNVAGGGAFNPFPNYSAYACSKSAIVRMTECLAMELKDKKIAVNAMAPGFVATEAHKETLEAGPERAGSLHYRRTQAILEGGGVPITVPVECVRFLLSPDADGLTGKTLSANFDPWSTETFRRRIREISDSDLYTLRRVNIVNLPQGPLREELLKSSSTAPSAGGGHSPEKRESSANEAGIPMPSLKPGRSGQGD